MSPVRFEQDYDAERAEDSRRWFSGPLGQRVEAAEMALLRNRVDDLFGAYGALVGPCHDARVLDALHLQHRIFAQVAAPARSAPFETGVTAVSTTVLDPGSLPFKNRMLDALILFHVLDITPHPHASLREAARVLADGGRMVITGFNPFSAWGVRRLFGGRRAPWNCNFISPMRLFDWLSLLDFRVESVDYTFHRLPLARGASAAPGRAGAKRRARYAPLPLGGIYVVKAVKRVAAARMQPELRRRVRARAAAVPLSGPTTLGQAARQRNRSAA